LSEDAEGWFAAASASVLEGLSGGREAMSSQLHETIPLLEGAITCTM